MSTITRLDAVGPSYFEVETLPEGHGLETWGPRIRAFDSDGELATYAGFHTDPDALRAFAEAILGALPAPVTEEDTAPAIVLPTEQGFYLDNEGDVWKLSYFGVWACLTEPDCILEPDEFAPFVRLVPEATDEEKAEAPRFSVVSHVGDPFGPTEYGVLDDLTDTVAEFGVLRELAISTAAKLTSGDVFVGALMWTAADFLDDVQEVQA